MKPAEDHALSILRVVERQEFEHIMSRAQAQASNAIEVRDGLLLWAERLLPYLDRDPHMTVAEALQRYQQAQSEAPPSTQ